MKSVIIFYEVLSREYFACDKIRKILEDKYNYKVGVYSILYEYYDAVKFAKKNGVECVVMPWMRLDENYNWITPFIDINEQVVICNFSHEQIASIETLITVIPTDEKAINEVIHFSWGEYFRDLLIENKVPKDNIVITGNSRLDFKQESKMSREKLASQFSLDVNKKWILFAEARDWVLDENNFEQRVKVGIDRDVEIESFKWNKKCLDETYKQINEMPNDFFEKFEFIYRPHPSCSNPKEITNKNVKVTANYSIYEWLSNVDYYISSASTSAFEADAMGLPVVCFEILDMPIDYKTYGLEDYYQINNLNILSEEVFKKAAKQVKGKDVYLKYIGDSDGKNCESTADAINGLVESENKKTHNKIKRSKFNFMLNKFKFTIKKFLMTTGLVRLVKSKTWCNLTYKDCPFKKENKKMYGIK